MRWRSEYVVSELKHIKKAAITCDGWTSITRDHYLTVTLHYVYEDRLHQKVLKTQAVYEAQTGPVVAEEIEAILKEFSIDLKGIVGVTVDNAYNMDVAVRRLKILKLGMLRTYVEPWSTKSLQCSVGEQVGSQDTNDHRLDEKEQHGQGRLERKTAAAV